VCVCLATWLSVGVVVYILSSVVTFILFHLSCFTASVYKRKHISAEVSTVY
jgi:hypothetical protein